MAVLFTLFEIDRTGNVRGFFVPDECGDVDVADSPNAAEWGDVCGLGRGRVIGRIEAGRDQGDPDLVPHRFVDDRAEDDVCVLMGFRLDHRGGLVDLMDGHVRTAGDVQQNAPGPLDGIVFQQR